MCVTKVPTGTVFRGQFLDSEFKRYEHLVYCLCFRDILRDSEGIRPLFTDFAWAVLELGWHITSWKRMQGLVKRMGALGFLDKDPLRVFPDYWIGDGNHRLCCAMVLNIPEVPVKIVEGRIRRRYVDRSWFAETIPQLLPFLDKTLEDLLRRY